MPRACGHHAASAVGTHDATCFYTAVAVGHAQSHRDAVDVETLPLLEDATLPANDAHAARCASYTMPGDALPCAFLPTCCTQ